MKILHLPFCFFLFITCCFKNGTAQILVNENFEGSAFPPSGWTLQNASLGNNWSQNVSAANAVSGTKSMQVLLGVNFPNAWAFTPALNFTAGSLYRVSYWYKTNVSTYAKQLKVTVGNSATVAAQTTTLQNHTLLTNTNFIQGVYTYTATANGTFFIGFNGTYGWNSGAGDLFVDSVVVQKMATAPCTGSPAVGSITGPSGVCAGVAFTLVLSGNYSDGGLTFQWQSSSAGANNFTNITGATGTAFTTSQSTALDYKCLVTCTNSGLTTASPVLNTVINNVTSCYCTPTATNCSLNDVIRNVTFSGINNPSACASDGYASYTSTVAAASVTVANSYPLSVTVGNGGTEYVSVWIDYNQNGVFESNEYKFIGSGNNAVVSNTVLIPGDALAGPTRMRVRLKYSAVLNAADACAGYTYGETEDYLVNITGTPTCNAAPAGGTTTTTAGAVCANVSFTLGASGASQAGGLAYQWQSSADNFTWNDIAAATGTTYATTQNVSTYYRRRITCTGTGQTAFSTVLQVVQNPVSNCYCTPTVKDCGSMKIDSVSFSSIVNTSLCGANGYSNYTTTIPATNVTAGTHQLLSVRVNSPYMDLYVAAWIDFNQDGIFAGPQEFTNLGLVGSSKVVSKFIKIPFNAAAGNTRIRITLNSLALTQNNACYTSTSIGETEDYLINILPNPTAATSFSYYVKAGSPAGDNGTSWTTAFNQVSFALSYAGANDTVRIARGIYREQCVLPDSVMLLGGYPNTGTPADAVRDWRNNKTILSGEPVVVNGITNYRTNVVTGTNLSANTILDGFIIEKGYVVYPTTGTGLHLVNSNIRIQNTVFRNNGTSDTDLSSSSFTFIGGSPYFLNCFFVENSDVNNPTITIKQNSHTRFTNCVFAGNRSNNIIYAVRSSATLKNCTLFNNEIIAASIKAQRRSVIYARSNAMLHIANSIFFNNHHLETPDSLDIFLDSSAINIHNTITQTYDYGNADLLSVNPKFKDTSSITGPDDLYFTNDDGLQLTNPCSKAINRGVDTSVAAISTDILGNLRVYSTSVDIGAYEVQSALSAVPSVVYVNQLATGANDGSSWTNAYTNLQTAMQACSDTIKIAAGSYAPSPDNKRIAFWLENKRVILGGYPVTGNPDNNQRNPILNPTILTGVLPQGGTLKSSIIIRGKNIDSTAIMDGVIISNSDNGNLGKGAALLLTFNASPHISNTIISNNEGGFFASGLITDANSNPVFKNCSFFNNIKAGYGSVYNTGNSIPVFKNCLFKGNSTNINPSVPGSGEGGALYNNNASPVIDSCNFIRNAANFAGGAIANFKGSNPLIINSGFYGNSAGSYGSEMINDASGPQVFNCTFSDSTITSFGGNVANFNGSNPLFTRCLFMNGNVLQSGGAIYNNSASPVFNGCAFTNATSRFNSVIYNERRSTVKLFNCIAAGNEDGGAFLANSKSSAFIINTTIINNGYYGTTTGPVITTGDSCALTVQNSILWNNNEKFGSVSAGPDIITVVNAATPVVITNSILQVAGATTGTQNTYGINPRLIDITNPAGPDNNYFTSDDGYGLCSCSPAINTGINVAIAPYSTDALNNSRVIGANVDIGAVEFQSTAVTQPATYFVNANAPAGNNGTSWADAYRELKTAISNFCADTIKVAQGTYKPSTAFKDSTFLVNRKLILLGGYPNSANPPDSVRNPDLYPTVLSGEIGNANDSADNIKTIMTINCGDTTVLIDGLTFTKASALFNGGGIYAIGNKNLTIQNCRFTKNYASGGSGIYSSGNINIERCVFTDNNTLRGTLRSAAGQVSIKNCVFYNNKAFMGAGIFIETNARIENTIFYGNLATFGSGIYLDDNPAAMITNCHFVRNKSVSQHLGIGLYNYNTYTVSRSNPVIRNCIFRGNAVTNLNYELDNSDWAWDNGSAPYSYDKMDIEYSAVNTTPPYNTTNLLSTGTLFKNIDNPIGADGLWFTADDGLQVEKCSNTINSGSNAAVTNIPADIVGNLRIKNVIVDIGAYEYQPTTPDYLLYNPGDSLIANVEKRTAGGWINYYKDCNLLLSVKAGTQNFGYIGDGRLKVVVKTTPLYSSGSATDLSNAAYVPPGVSWQVMNRSWSITPTVPLTDSLLIRFPFSNTDLTDVTGSNPSVTTHQQLAFYKVDAPYQAHALNVPANRYSQYTNGPSASTTQWRYSTADTINYAEFYVKSFGSGGAGAGTGYNGGALAANNNGCAGATRIFNTTITGSTYQWQLYDGGSYINLNDNANYSGTTTNTLTITNPSASWYGNVYRCVVNGSIYNSYNTLKFQNIWNGSVNSSWENPANWSCGRVPDINTDVIVNSGTIVINSNAAVRSLTLKPSVNLTVGSGYTLTIFQ